MTLPRPFKDWRADGGGLARLLHVNVGGRRLKGPSRALLVPISTPVPLTSDLVSVATLEVRTFGQI